MKKLLLVSMLLLVFAVAAFAGTARNIYQKVTCQAPYDVLTYVTNTGTTTSADYRVRVWMLERPTEILTTELGQPGYTAPGALRLVKITAAQPYAAILVQIGTFTTQWVAGNTLHYEVTRLATSEVAEFNLVIPAGTGTYTESTLQVIPPFPPAGFTLEVTSNYAGAAIYRDGNPTGQVTPYTFPAPATAGTYTLMLPNVLWTTAPYVYAATANETVHFVGVKTPDPAMNPVPADLHEFHIAFDAVATPYNLSWEAPIAGPAPTGYYLVWNGAPQVDLGNVLSWITPAIAEGNYTWMVIPYITDPAKGTTRSMGPVKAVLKDTAAKGASTAAVNWHFTVIRDAAPTTTYTLNVNGPDGYAVAGPVAGTTDYVATDANDMINDLVGSYTIAAAPAGFHWLVNPIVVAAGDFTANVATIEFVLEADAPVDITVNADGTVSGPAGTVIVPAPVPPVFGGTDTGIPAVVNMITSTGTHDVVVTRPVGYPVEWYCWIVVAGNVLEAANPIITPTYTFANVNFDAKGDVFVVVDDNETLPVELSAFNAVLTADLFVKLTWVTESETGLVGYRVYRSDVQDYASAVLVTPVMIDATNTSEQHTYNYTDREVEVNNTYWYWLEAVDYNNTTLHGPVSVEVLGNVTPPLPTTTVLGNAYPNPFKANTNISVAVKAGETATVTIYNILGQAVRTYKVSEGSHTINWDGRDSRNNNCGSGIYFYKMSSPSMNQTKKMVIVK